MTSHKPNPRQLSGRAERAERAVKLWVTIFLTHCLWPRRNPNGQKFKFVENSPGGGLGRRDSVLQHRRHRSGKNVSIPLANFETSMVPPHRSSVA